MRVLLVPIFLLATTPSQDGVTVEQLERYRDEIIKDIEILRGESFTRGVTVKIADKATFVRETMKRADALLPDGMIDGLNELCRMLALIPADGDLLGITLEMAQDAAGGFYIPGSDTFYLMEGISGGMAKSILSHELVHALDDQLYDIDAGMSSRLDNSDAAYAYSAIVEGCAMSVESRWSTEYLDPRDIDIAEAMKLAQDSMAGMVRQPPYVWVPFLSAYTSGASFLVRSDSVVTGTTKLATPADVAAAYANPPRSSEQVLHPEKYWDAERRDDPRSIEFATDDLPSGWRVVCEDTLGEIALALLVDTIGTPLEIDATNPLAIFQIEYTNQVGEGWGGDRVIVLGKEEARYLRLVTVWDTPRDAAEFYGALILFVDDLEERLEAISRLTRGEKERPRAVATLAYGESDVREVVLELSYGLRRSKLKAVATALRHSEVQ
ncbi:MAG: hypothetical protein GY711_29710 [bacterium]|nr:hypothetical protein [bacterium]